jgi:hypothetical protein
MGLPTLALSSSDRTVYDQSDVQPGKIINGKVMNVVKLKTNPDQASWHVFVKDRETGELLLLHVDQGTTRKDTMVSPDLGDNVIAKYNEENNHAYSFLTDERDHN